MSGPGVGLRRSTVTNCCYKNRTTSLRSNQETSLDFILTQLGQRTLAVKGLEKEIFYYTLYDQEVNYQIDAYPNFILELNGSKKSITSDTINFRNNLT